MTVVAAGNEQKLSLADEIWQLAFLGAMTLVCACGSSPLTDAAAEKSAALPATKSATTPPPGEVESCAKQAARIEANTRALAQGFCHEATLKGVPGAVLGIRSAPDEAPIWITHGVGCVDSSAPTTKATVFPIASLTKSAAALVVLDLLDKNRRALSDELDPGGHSARVIDLLQQRSGLRLEGAQGTRDPDRATTWFDPGHLWHYDNLNYERLGEWFAAEEWDLQAAWTQRFGTVGPTLGRPLEGDIACEHLRSAGEHHPLPGDATPRRRSLAGDAWASGEQLWELLDQVADEGRMRADPVPTGEGDRYGLGLRIESNAWSHAGASPGAWSWFMENDRGARVSIMVNVNSDLDETRRRTRSLLFGLEPETPIRAIEPEEIIGRYTVRAWNTPITIRSSDGVLRMDVPALGAQGVRLRPRGRNRFYAHLPLNRGSETIVFVRRGAEIWARSPWFVALKDDRS